jgi:hypothetical protein
VPEAIGFHFSSLSMDGNQMEFCDVSDDGLVGVSTVVKDSYCLLEELL